MNKKTTRKQREGVLVRLLEVMIEKVKAMGFKLVMCITTEELSNKKGYAQDWIKNDKEAIVTNNMSQYIKVIN
jgi:triosephosphate isomerase